MSRKPGKAYVVDNDWRKRVEISLHEKGWSRADLARESGVGKSTITELLNGKTDSCLELPAIHKALGWRWSEALPLVSKDAGELLGLWDQLNDFEKGRLLERARAIFEAQQVGSRRKS